MIEASSTDEEDHVEEGGQDRSRALEAALPDLISRLERLQSELDDDEREIFKYIIESAARHTALVEAREETPADPALKDEYRKPRSVHATVGMKRQFHELPRRLGLSEDA
jgi:hypothetical protein